MKDHLKAAGILIGIILALSLYIWGAIITNGGLVLATIVILIVGVVYFVILGTIRGEIHW